MSGSFLWAHPRRPNPHRGCTLKAMSYEGCEQLLCANGHYWTCDAHDKRSGCPDCGGEAVWVNDVDETNCDDVGWIDMSSLVIKPAVLETCNLGHVHETAPTVYRIPTGEETEDARTVFVDGKRVPLKQYVALCDVHGS